MRRLILAAWLAVPLMSAHAQSVPASPEARPRGEPASQSSVANAAPTASTTQTTGSTTQDPMVKQMNGAEKAKVEKEGK